MVKQQESIWGHNTLHYPVIPIQPQEMSQCSTIFQDVFLEGSDEAHELPPLLGEGTTWRLSATSTALHGDEEHVMVPKTFGAWGKLRE